jgi:hypothetical protein
LYHFRHKNKMKSNGVNVWFQSSLSRTSQNPSTAVPN